MDAKGKLIGVRSYVSKELTQLYEDTPSQKGTFKGYEGLKVFLSTIYERRFIFRSESKFNIHNVSKTKIERKSLDFLAGYDIECTSGIQTSDALSRIETNNLII